MSERRLQEEGAMVLAKTRLRAALTVGAVTLLPLTGLPAVSVADTSSTQEPAVVASGLDNPRQLSFGKHGELYIAEAGAGGSGPCVDTPEGGTACFGLSGAITRVMADHQRRVVKRLPSL